MVITRNNISPNVAPQFERSEAAETLSGAMPGRAEFLTVSRALMLLNEYKSKS